MDKDLWDKMTKFTPLSEMIKEELLPNVEKVDDNIWVVRNFISEEDRKTYVDYAESLEEEVWWKKNREWWLGKFILIDDESPLKDLSVKISEKVKSLLQDDIYLGSFGSIHRLTEGHGMFIHTDNPTEVRELTDDNGEHVGETSGHNNYCILAMVVYLNDFNGGEIFFPRLGLDYKASAGDLLLFPGTGREYDHGVRPLLAGPTRYITTGFGYDPKAEKLKKANYVFEDPKTGEFVEVEPGLITNKPEQAENMPHRTNS